MSTSISKTSSKACPVKQKPAQKRVFQLFQTQNPPKKVFLNFFSIEKSFFLLNFFNIESGANRVIFFVISLKSEKSFKTAKIVLHKFEYMSQSTIQLKPAFFLKSHQIQN